MTIRRRLLRMVAMTLLAIVCGFGFIAGCMIVRQEKMIYLPRRYDDAERSFFVSQGLEALTFTTSQGTQVAHWLPPSFPQKEFPNIWLIFSGNGGCSMDYLSVARSGSQSSGWLFVDYPSYGSCEGKPTPDTIRETARGAIHALALTLDRPEHDLLPTLGAFGHSIGAAVALDIAADVGMQRAVIVSPFTSMQDMAARFVTPLLAGFVRHRFDNRVSIDRLAANGARVIILHGTSDAMIPRDMGRRLATRHKEATSFIPIDGAGHNDVIDRGERQIAESLMALE